MLKFHLEWLDGLIQDLRYAVRVLAKNRVFTATALLVLALGISSSTAIFSVINGVLLRPLPFAAPDRLVQLYGTPAERGEAIASADVNEFRTAGTSFETLAGYTVTARYFQRPDGPERIMTVEAERDFFSVLGVQAQTGRTFQPQDPSGVAVAGGAFARRFGGPSIIGQALNLDGGSVTIIGIMPESFQFPYTSASLLQSVASQSLTDLWIIWEAPPAQATRTRLSRVTGRLKAGVPLSVAQSEVSVIMKRLEAQYPDRVRGLGVRIVPLSEAVVAPPVRRSLFILFAAAAIVLAVACANVTSLSLVRVTMRSREVAARVALGARRSHLGRQFLAESLLLSLAGGLLGLALSWWGTQTLLKLAAAQIPRAREVGMDWSVFLFSIASCLASGLMLGLAPAFAAMRTDPQSILKEATSHSTMATGQRGIRNLLAVTEVALAFVLCVGATLLIRELVRLHHTKTGMVTENVATFHVGQRMTPGMDGRQFYEIAERVAKLPRVRSAGFTQMIPLQNWGWQANSGEFRIRGRPALNAPLFSFELRYVTPGYFQTLGIPVKQGRAFTNDDTRGARQVIVMNETLASRIFGNEDPIGKETTRGTVVGVVGDVRQVHLDWPASPELYYPIAQNWSQVPELGVSLVVSTEGNPLALVDGVSNTIREVNPNLAVFSVRTMDGVIRDSLAEFTLYLWLIAMFAGVALFLASSGTYGVISYIATSRTKEFAIRAALGAQRKEVTRLVLGQALGLTGIGLGLGLVGTVAATPLLKNLPVGVRSPDTSIVVPVAVVIGAVAVGACLVPARRAARIDPMTTLRAE